MARLNRSSSGTVYSWYSKHEEEEVIPGHKFISSAIRLSAGLFIRQTHRIPLSPYGEEPKSYESLASPFSVVLLNPDVTCISPHVWFLHRYEDC